MMTAPVPYRPSKSDPAYRAISAKLQANAWRIGAAIKPTVLADHFGVSVTPIREALQRLFYEQRVNFKRGKGYSVQAFEVKAVRDCYEVTLALLTHSVMEHASDIKRALEPLQVPTPLPGAKPTDDLLFAETQATWRESLSTAAVSMCQNREMDRILALCNARTHVIRVLECTDIGEDGNASMVLQDKLRSSLPKDILESCAHLKAYIGWRVDELPARVDLANQNGSKAPLP